MTEPLLTPEEAAERLHVSTKTLRSLRQQGLIRYVAVTERKLFYRPEDCDDFIVRRSRMAVPIPQRPTRGGRKTVARSGNVVPIRPFSERQEQAG